MRLLSFGIVALALLRPASARAQSVKPADLVGTWRGNVSVQEESPAGNVKYVKDGIGWLVLWPDSLFWLWNSDDGEGHTWGQTSAGPWRLAGDTLWLAGDWGYTDTLEARIIARPDTAKPAPWPKYHAVFWTTSQSKRDCRGSCITAYRIQLANGQFSLTPLDSLAKNPQAAPVGVYQRSSARPPRR